VTGAFLTGPRIHLRALEPTDAPLLAAWRSHPEVRRFLSRSGPGLVTDEEAMIARAEQAENEVAFGIARNAGGTLVGYERLRGIQWKDRGATVAVLLGPDHLGSGLGTEALELLCLYAFDTLGLHRLSLHVQKDNARAVRCYEKVGFEVEAVLRADRFREGAFVDSLSMGLLAARWRERRAL
jgi:RimJ/RimL family protein N-acetyltransferase